MTKKDDQNLVNLSFSRIETSANFAGRYCLLRTDNRELFYLMIPRLQIKFKYPTFVLLQNNTSAVATRPVK